MYRFFLKLHHDMIAFIFLALIGCFPCVRTCVETRQRFLHLLINVAPNDLSFVLETSNKYFTIRQRLK